MEDGNQSQHCNTMKTEELKEENVSEFNLNYIKKCVKWKIQWQLIEKLSIILQHKIIECCECPHIVHDKNIQCCLRLHIVWCSWNMTIVKYVDMPRCNLEEMKHNKWHQQSNNELTYLYVATLNIWSMPSCKLQITSHGWIGVF